MGIEKSPAAFRTISEAGKMLSLPAHVLRFWESKFPQIKPVKRGGGRRFYRPNDVLVLFAIKKLLHGNGMTIAGVKRLIRETGIKEMMALGEKAKNEPKGPESTHEDSYINKILALLDKDQDNSIIFDQEKLTRIKYDLLRLKVKIRERIDNAYTSFPS